MSFDQPFFILLHIATFGFFVSLAVSGFMISAGLLDEPVGRSAHDTAIPTGGGVGIVAGFGAALLGLGLYYPAFGNGTLLGTLATLGLTVACLGLVDDVHHLYPKSKFVILVILAGICTYFIGPPDSLPVFNSVINLPYLAGFAGAVLWIFVATNGVNFMDGANGMMGLCMLTAFAMLGLYALMQNATNTALISFAMIGAIAGFLPYNARDRAWIFSGDVGALLCGFVFAAAVLILVEERPQTGVIYLGPLLILPFLTDILLTLARRIRYRQNLLSAHNTHLYQRMIRSGYSHVSISTLYASAGLIFGLGGLAVTKTALMSLQLWFGISLIASALSYFWLSRKFD